MDALVPVLLDGIVAVLLLATIGLALILNRRLGTLRAGRGELERLLREVEQALRAASAAATALHQAAETNGGQLQATAERAIRLRTELAWLVDAGNRQAERLERLRPPADATAPAAA